MNKLTQDWIAALRSGKYKQGKQKLRTTNGRYCCLGVLCEVAGIPAEDKYDTGTYTYNDAVIALPYNIKLSMSYQSKLVDMNDSGKTFDEIADYIKSHRIEATLNVTL